MARPSPGGAILVAATATMTAILGISAFYHDAAAALIVDGRVVAAVQEERFSRRKHDASFPHAAIEACLREAGLTAGDLDYVAFYEKPLVKFERMLETAIAFAPVGLRNFAASLPGWINEKLHVRRIVRRRLRGASRARIVYLDHHESHAASAYFPSPFDEAAILTLDGVGEWSTAAWGVGRGNRLELHEHLKFPHSLGLLYSAFTSYCGFEVNEGEYKLMGLASYGRPTYRELILQKLVDLGDDGGLRLDVRYFDFAHGLTMTNRRFHALFGGPPRMPDGPLDERHRDLAASVQAVCEEVILRMTRHVHGECGARNLVLAGGVALNAVAIGRLLREGPFDRVWVQPAAGDAGGALGAAWFAWHQLLDRPRDGAGGDRQLGSLLGPAYANDVVRTALDAAAVPYTRYDDEAGRIAEAARLLAEGKVVGWFDGRVEFGPRALGSRSILADARSATMQETLNVRIKRRETFRPFAPIVLAERAPEYFELPAGGDAGYMTFTVPVRPERRAEIPAVTHVDGGARVQTVDAWRHPRLHALLTAFAARTGCPVLLNTSFNVRGEPIVCTPDDAIHCFATTGLDALVIGDCLVRKEEPGTGGAPLPDVRGLSAVRPLPHGRGFDGRGPDSSFKQWSEWPKMLVSYAATAVIFYGLLTPLGLLFRLVGRDALRLRRPPGDAASYWRPKPGPNDVRRYFRPF